MPRRRRNELYVGLSGSTRRVSLFISPADIVSGMEVTQKELEKAMKEIDKKLALPDEKFEKYASDLLERAVKGLRRSR
jgi:hypothetical protein